MSWPKHENVIAWKYLLESINRSKKLLDSNCLYPGGKAKRSFQRTFEALLGIGEIGLLEKLRNEGARRSEARPGNELVFLKGEARQPVAGCGGTIFLSDRRR